MTQLLYLHYSQQHLNLHWRYIQRVPFFPKLTACLVLSFTPHCNNIKRVLPLIQVLLQSIPLLLCQTLARVPNVCHPIQRIKSSFIMWFLYKFIKIQFLRAGHSLYFGLNSFHRGWAWQLAGSWGENTSSPFSVTTFLLP